MEEIIGESLPRDSETLYLQMSEEELRNQEIEDRAQILSEKWLALRTIECPLCEGMRTLRLSFKYIENHKIVCEACKFSWVEGREDESLNRAYQWIDYMLKKGEKNHYPEKRRREIEKTYEVGDWGSLEDLKAGKIIRNFG